MTRTFLGLAVIGFLVFSIDAATAYQTGQNFGQAESRNASGQIVVEASIIHVIECNSPGERGGQYYIYQYTNRPGFRAILPPNWGNAIGGHDFASFQAAAAAACGSGGVTTPPNTGSSVITVTTATYGGNCRAPQGNMTRVLGGACNGKKQCSYTIDYTVIGDPAVGCPKDYVAQWQCSGGGSHTTSAPAEAGYNKVINLTCP